MAQLSPDKNLEKGLQELEALGQKCEIELKKQCQILDDIELQEVKQEPFEKRSWSSNILQNARPFDKGFIKKTNFPSVFQKKNSKVSPEQLVSTATKPSFPLS